LHVGFFFDLRNPAGWRRPWADHYAQTLERIETIERLGGDAVWFTEHHGWEDGYLPQPLTFAAAVAARTARIRIGTAILLAPLRNARHIAEEAAIVDLLSRGRLELGLGAGWATREFESFGVDRERRFDLTDAAVEEVRHLLDDRVVMPPPVQRPFPLWLGYQGKGGARRAGRLGVGLLSLDPRLQKPYEEGLREAGHAASSARMGGLVNLVVADDPEEARETLLPFYAYQFNTYERARRTSRGEPRGGDASVDDLRALDRPVRGRWPSGPGLAVYTVEEAIEAIRERVDGLPARHVYLWASIAGMPDDLADRHIELVCSAVRPALS
jgi:alkanesulfonate monooxygenase SsuD/methylene tetrahydromethanopterin reductase-like flavin-dependent oxidoreductase (luciferase family)